MANEKFIEEIKRAADDMKELFEPNATLDHESAAASFERNRKARL